MFFEADVCWQFAYNAVTQEECLSHELDFLRIGDALNAKEGERIVRIVVVVLAQTITATSNGNLSLGTALHSKLDHQS